MTDAISETTRRSVEHPHIGFDAAQEFTRIGAADGKKY
jgi:hypothetical protein